MLQPVSADFENGRDILSRSTYNARQHFNCVFYARTRISCELNQRARFNPA